MDPLKYAELCCNIELLSQYFKNAYSKHDVRSFEMLLLINIIFAFLLWLIRLQQHLYEDVLTRC